MEPMVGHGGVAFCGSPAAAGRFASGGGGVVQAAEAFWPEGVSPLEAESKRASLLGNFFLSFGLYCAGFIVRPGSEPPCDHWKPP